MVTVYRGKGRWIPVHNGYWSNSNFRTATWIMKIIHSRTDEITQRVSVQSSHQYTPNDTQDSLRSYINPLFDLRGSLITFICYFSLSVLYCLTQFPFYRISTSIHRINLLISFQFRRTECWLTSLTFVTLSEEMLLYFHSECFVFIISMPDLNLTGSLSSDSHYNTSFQITTFAALPTPSFNTLT
jgi:hypothetical protein